VTDRVVLAAALLHDTIEDTETSYEELRGTFDTPVADCVIEVTATKFLGKDARKRLQIAKAGRSTLKVYDRVRRELAAGRKESHWMWFIFPQMAGLGFSPMARKFGIASEAEALSYLQHAVLGPRLRECTTLLLACPDPDIHSILGSPDDLKFRSAMTLFAAVAPGEPVFRAALERFYGGEGDVATIGLLERSGGGAGV
jgi:uncharacterized protein (DUF1810 family)